MCFHASQTKTLPELENQYNAIRSELFEIDDNDFIAYHLNGFSHPEMLIIPQESKEELHPCIWGFIPEYELGSNQNEYFKKSARYGGGLNARSEKVFQSSMYKNAIFEKRCIIPLTGFFEPHEYKGIKYPFYVSKKQNQVLSVAGIYAMTKDGVMSFSMLTKTASPFFSEVHNTKDRQIILMDDQLVKEWLRDDLNEKLIKELIEVDYQDNLLNAYPVDRAIFSAKKESNYEEILKEITMD